jgi:uncharacterized membrane protein YadS
MPKGAKDMSDSSGQASNGDVVTNAVKSRLSDLWKEEDYWAIWLGTLVLVIGLVVIFNNAPEGMESRITAANATMLAEEDRAPFKTVAWYQAEADKNKLKALNSKTGQFLQTFSSKPHGWKNNPLEAFYLSGDAAAAKSTKGQAKYDAAKEKATATLTTAKEKEASAAAASFQNETLNAEAQDAIIAWLAAKSTVSKTKKKANVEPYNIIPNLIGLVVIFAILFGVGKQVMGESFAAFGKGFGFVFAIAILAFLCSGQATLKAYGIGYAAWAIAIGLLISNTVGTPRWVKPAVQTEFFIKTGLVLLGAEILFSKILAIGVPGIFVAWVVTPIVLVSTYIFGQKVVKIPSKTLNITISADMSVCGVSAAIATASACRAKKEELTLAVGLSLVFTSIMMIVMPAFIKAVGMPEILGGAWMGGTIDATGAVAAAGAFLGEKALYTAATIKMIQNVLIGVIAFFVAWFWVVKVDRQEGQKVSPSEIWTRFPKFVIGFIGASIIFSFIYGSLGPDTGYIMIDQGVIKGLTKNLRGWLFCLAFVSIGLATDFRELKSYFKGGKPLILYVCGQSFNLALTLILAYIMFYKVFPQITARI